MLKFATGGNMAKARITVDEKMDRQLYECGKYYDVLYGFSKTISAINMKAEDGIEIKKLQERFIKLIPAFVTLCGEGELEGKKKAKKRLKNTLIVRDGWGICPRCGKKCIRVNIDTVLVNSIMYCKHCKQEYVVTWRDTQ